MSVRVTPFEPAPELLDSNRFGAASGYNAWNAAAPAGEPEGIAWARYFDVLKRHIILIALVVMAGSALGVYAARRVKPVYNVQTTIWINAGSSQQTGGPIRSQELLPQTSWVELLKSFAIVEPVVRQLNLNFFYKDPRDSVLFREFSAGPSPRAGSYILRVSPDARSYVLSTASNGFTLERGTPGDSIGRKLGLLWAPEARLLRPGRMVAFSVTTLRNASGGLLGQMRTSLPEDGQFLTIALSGTDPQRTTKVVTALAAQFVRSATDLKKHHLLEFKKTLADQLAVAEGELRTSEAALQQFRASTITLPSGGSPLVAGQTGRDPTVSGYFLQRETLDDVRIQRTAVERILADATAGVINPEAFLQLPSVLNSTPQLRLAIDELSSRQAALRSEQQYLTDANPRIKQLQETVRILQSQTIPQLTRGVLQALRAREAELSARMDSRASELRGIPSREIDEMRLVRQVAASENLYTSLKARYEEVSLSEAQATPDLSVLDSAAVPLRPSSNSAPRLLLAAILASIAFAFGIALVRDRMDRRFRYPEDATRELGLSIAGTVPQFKSDRRGELRIDTLSQAIESFRTLRLAIRYDFPGEDQITLSVSSPGPGDGKSLVSSNLALAFASAGHRTLLIDGDIRCGTQNRTFNVPVCPGLVEYLDSEASVEAVVKKTGSENLFLLPCGSRRNRSPGRLLSEQMSLLVQSARQQFEVVIIDSPPFIAGVDAFALGAVAGSMLVVLRPSVSDRKLAAAKLEIVDRLPIRVLGAVLNGVPDGGMYRYYGSDYYYAGEGAKESPENLATPKGLVLRA